MLFWFLLEIMANRQNRETFLVWTINRKITHTHTASVGSFYSPQNKLFHALKICKYLHMWKRWDKIGVGNSFQVHYAASLGPSLLSAEYENLLALKSVTMKQIKVRGPTEQN